MKHFIKTLFCLCLLFSFCASGSMYAQTAGLDQSVMLRATVQDSPPRIHLHWIATVSCQGFDILRKKKTDANFATIASALPGTATDWVDSNVVVGEEYEYQVYRFGGAGIWGGSKGYGYISSGIRVDPKPWKGSVLLLVDSKRTLPDHRHALFRHVYGPGVHIRKPGGYGGYKRSECL